MQNQSSSVLTTLISAKKSGIFNEKYCNFHVSLSLYVSLCMPSLEGFCASAITNHMCCMLNTSTESNGMSDIAVSLKFVPRLTCCCFY